MIVWCRRFVLTSLLAFAVSSAWAANPLLLLNDTTGSNPAGNVSGTLTWYGFTVSATCTISSNGGTTSNCASGNNLELEAVPSGRDTLTFEILNSATPGSAILTSTSGTSTLTVGLTFTGSPSTFKATGVTSTTTGYAGFNCSSCSGLSSPTGQTTFTNPAVTTPLTDSLPLQKGLANSGSATQETNAASATSFTAANSFTATNVLTLNPAGKTVERLEFDAFALRFTTAPEPASLSLLLFGVGGLAMVQRRRRRSLVSRPV
jgi:hypothetical protein